MGAGPAGNDAEPGFRQSDLDVDLGDPDVGRCRDFQPAAQGMSVEHGDDRLAQTRQRIEGAVGRREARRGRNRWRIVGPGLDVSTGGEGLARPAVTMTARMSASALDVAAAGGDWSTMRSSSALSLSGRLIVSVAIGPSKDRRMSCVSLILAPVRFCQDGTGPHP